MEGVAASPLTKCPGPQDRYLTYWSLNLVTRNGQILSTGPTAALRAELSRSKSHRGEPKAAVKLATLLAHPCPDSILHPTSPANTAAPFWCLWPLPCMAGQGWVWEEVWFRVWGQRPHP